MLNKQLILTLWAQGKYRTALQNLLINDSTVINYIVNETSLKQLINTVEIFNNWCAYCKKRGVSPREYNALKAELGILNTKILDNTFFLIVDYLDSKEVW